MQGTQPRVSTSQRGRGIEVQMGTSAELVRVVVEDNHDVAVNVAGSASAAIRDLIVRDTHSRPAVGQLGRGLTVYLDSTVTLSGGLIERDREGGVSAVGEGTSVTLDDVVVRDVTSHDCVGGSCAWPIWAWASAPTSARR